MATPQTGFSVIQIRRASTATWNSTNPILRKGEPGVEFKTNGTYRLKIGDGVTAWNNLAYVTGVTIDELSDVTISSPQNDQGIVYENGIWKNKTVIAAASVAKLKPSPATDGALWFDPEDGRLYRYYVDTDSTAQWIEIKQAPAQQSNLFTSPVTMQSTLSVSGTTTLSTPLGIASGGTGNIYGAGLIPVVPTSGNVTVSSGTASVAASGEITFSSVGALRLDNIFTSQYSDYRVVLTVANSVVGAGLYVRGRSGGVNNTNTLYYTGGTTVDGYNGGLSGGTLSSYSFYSTVYVLGGGAGFNTGVIDITNAKSALRMLSHYVGWNNFHAAFSTVHAYNGSATFDGIELSESSGTITGRIQVFGYKNS